MNLSDFCGGSGGASAYLAKVPIATSMHTSTGNVTFGSSTNMVDIYLFGAGNSNSNNYGGVGGEVKFIENYATSQVNNFYLVATAGTSTYYGYEWGYSFLRKNTSSGDVIAAARNGVLSMRSDGNVTESNNINIASRYIDVLGRSSYINNINRLASGYLYSAGGNSFGNGAGYQNSPAPTYGGGAGGASSTSTHYPSAGGGMQMIQYE